MQWKDATSRFKVLYTALCVILSVAYFHWFGFWWGLLASTATVAILVKLVGGSISWIFEALIEDIISFEFNLFGLNDDD